MFFHFHSALRSAVVAAAVIAACTQAVAEKPAAPPNVIYSATGEVPALDRSAAKLFSDRYQIVTVHRGAGFVRARIKGFNIYLPDSKDPRSTRDARTPAKASIGYVVTAEGLVKDLRVLESTDKRVADFLVKQIERRRFAPAQYRGSAVASLEHTEVRFGPIDERDNSSMFKDGLGNQGQRDR